MRNSRMMPSQTEVKSLKKRLRPGSLARRSRIFLRAAGPRPRGAMNFSIGHWWGMGGEGLARRGPSGVGGGWRVSLVELMVCYADSRRESHILAIWGVAGKQRSAFGHGSPFGSHVAIRG